MKLKKKERNIRIAIEVLEGETLKATGLKYHISPGWVRQIVCQIIYMVEKHLKKSNGVCID